MATPPDYLVSKEMSWMDALHYCRERHLDLVSVTSPEMHSWVKKVAEKATTQHVWLGLHYLSSLDIWFWVNGETLCFDKLATESEKESRGEGCSGDGRAGALQRSNGTWVSLNESTKLNFICAAGEEK